MSSTAKAPPVDQQTEDDVWNEETAPHAARDKALNRGAPHPARQHDPHGDRHSKHGGERGMKGRSHLPAHEKKGGSGGT